MYKLADILSSLTAVASLQATYWNIYMGTILAILAFLLNNWDKPKHPLAVSFLASGLATFFASNCFQIYALQKRYNQGLAATIEYARKNADQISAEFFSFLVDRPPAPSAFLILALHLVIDSCVIGIVIFNYRRTSAISTQIQS